MKLPGWLLATLTLLFAGLCWGAAAAAPETERWAALSDVVFEHLARDNELPNSTAPTALAEDGEGFLWVGTQNGLARWDGYHFRSYKADPSTPGALPDNFIRKLHTDTFGRLWIATNSGGLARYDRDRDRFLTWGAGPNGLSSASLRDIVDDGAGGIWIATDDASITCAPTPDGSSICGMTAAARTACPITGSAPCSGTTRARSGWAPPPAWYGARLE